MAAHVLGAQGRSPPGEIDDFRSRGRVRGNETVGKGGVEQRVRNFLRGTPGSYTREVDGGRADRPRGHLVASRGPAATSSSTIDATAQAALEKALAEQVSLNGLSTGAARLGPTGEVPRWPRTRTSIPRCS